MRSSTTSSTARRALIDTSAFFALIDPRDAQHITALAIRERLIAEKWRLFTTNFILAETHALLLARLGRVVALKSIQAIDRSNTNVVRVVSADEGEARAIITQYNDKDFSLTDAISFAVMDRLGITQALTFDRHLVQYGVTALIGELPR